MAKIIVIEYVTLDGIVEDPDGRGGSAADLHAASTNQKG